MILVVLGTQDKPFTRLCDALEEQVNTGLILDSIVMQKGDTPFVSKTMQVFDLMSIDEFEKLMDKADLIISHGGVGTILNAVKKGKRVLACPRLAKYGEHGNDHQLQLCEAFSKKGYIQVCEDFNELHQRIEAMQAFQPKPYESTTNAVVNEIWEYINQ